MELREVFFLWVGGATSWLYLVHYAVHMEGQKPFNFFVAFGMALLWPFAILFSTIAALRQKGSTP